MSSFSSSPANVDQVDYDALDGAKAKFIAAARSTLRFAEPFGFVPSESLGASANVFSLQLGRFLREGAEELHITLLPEGLGTADDARPEDLTEEELRHFWYNIGWKTMSCLTNDAASTGMQTILIGLYLPSSTPETVFSAPFLDGFLPGIVDGCRKVGCVYLSGETPQLKTKITPGKLDVAGALFGLMPPGVKPITGEDLGAGDRIVLVESSGPHENGFTPLRKLAESLEEGYRTRLPDGRMFWEAANAPSHLYTPLVQELFRAGIRPTALENITGHGWQKIMRSGKALRYVVTELLPVPPLFSFVEKRLGVGPKEMLEIFNYGAGFAIFTKSEEDARRAVEIAGRQGLRAVVAGRVEAADEREVVVEPLGVKLGGTGFGLRKG
jgi:phosphoribosylformylglycinamidine cyclo-ligase